MFWGGLKENSRDFTGTADQSAGGVGWILSYSYYSFLFHFFLAGFDSLCHWIPQKNQSRFQGQKGGKNHHKRAPCWDCNRDLCFFVRPTWLDITAFQRRASELFSVFTRWGQSSGWSCQPQKLGITAETNLVGKLWHLVGGDLWHAPLATRKQRGKFLCIRLYIKSVERWRVMRNSPVLPIYKSISSREKENRACQQVVAFLRHWEARVTSLYS